LFGDTGELSHFLFPVVDFILGSSVLVVFGAGIRCIKSLLDGGRPLLEESLETVDHVGDLSAFDVTAFEELLDLRLILLGVSLQLDVAVDGFQSFSELVGELVEDSGELLLGLVITLVPGFVRKTVDHGFEALVDAGVQSCDGVL
jgi:hypothetical protein